MTNKKALFTWIITISLLAFIVLLSACKTSTDPDPEPEPEPPVLPDGERIMLVSVFDQDINELTGYDIDISGPTSASATNVSGSVYTFDNLADGEYSIVVTREDYIEADILFEVKLPESRTADVTYERSLILVKKAEPVVINNNEDNAVETAPSDDPEAGEDEKTVLRIPANSIPQSALDENGNIQIRVTRSTPSKLTAGDDGGTVSDRFTMEPIGLELNNEIEIEMPINVVPGVNYVLQPGNIPLTAVASKTVGQTTGPHANQRTVTTLSARINSFHVYTVVADITIEYSGGNLSEPFRVGQDGACGQEIQWSYDMPYVVSGNLNTIPSHIRPFATTFFKNQENKFKQYSGTDSNTSNSFYLRKLGQHNFNYIRAIQNNNVIQEVRHNLETIFDVISVECHNSGAGG